MLGGVRGPAIDLLAAPMIEGLAVYLTPGTTIEPDGPKPDRRATFVGVTSRW